MDRTTRPHTAHTHTAQVITFPAPQLAPVMPLNHPAYPHYRRLHTIYAMMRDAVDSPAADPVQLRSALRYLIIEAAIAADEIAAHIPQTTPGRRALPWDQRPPTPPGGAA